MLKSLRVDNYKSLVNFDLFISEKKLLLMGANGSGKTTIFEILENLKDFILYGSDVSQLFPASTLTRWQTNNEQTFEFELLGNGGTYHYCLKIEHDAEHERARMKHEALYFDNNPLYKFELTEENGYLVSKARLYKDDFSEGPLVSFDWSKSGLHNIQERADNKKLTWFKHRIIQRLLVIRLNPSLMRAESRAETPYLMPDLSNFTDWFRYLMQDMEIIFQLSSELKEILQGFESFKLKQTGEREKVLTIKFTGYEIRFNELSDGQRALIALYTLLYAFPETEGYTLCIDEPENYLALAEIDPWLYTVYDQSEETDGQFLLISHHPKLINSLTEYASYWLSKEAINAPTRCQTITNNPENVGISIADLVERGWIYVE